MKEGYQKWIAELKQAIATHSGTGGKPDAAHVEAHKHEPERHLVELFKDYPEPLRSELVRRAQWDWGQVPELDDADHLRIAKQRAAEYEHGTVPGKGGLPLQKEKALRTWVVKLAKEKGVEPNNADIERIMNRYK